MGNELFRVLRSANEFRLDEIHQSVCMGPTLEEEIKTIMLFDHVHTFVRLATLEDDLFEVQEGTFVCYLLSNLDGGTPRVRGEALFALVAL